MKAIVINLDSETERMTFQKNQLDSFGIEYQRLPAVSLNGHDDPIYKQYAMKWERMLMPAEVACFLSHKSAWGIALNSSEPLLILEDDACFAENMRCVLKELEVLKDVDYVNIEVTGTNKKKLLAKKSVSELCESKLFRMYQGRSGAGGYILWPTGAKKLLDQVKKGKVGLADKFINANYALLSYQLDPAVLIQLDQCVYHGIEAPLKVESTITPQSDAHLKRDKCTVCKLKRLISQLKVGINHLLHLHHANKRKVILSKYLFNLSSKK